MENFCRRLLWQSHTGLKTGATREREWLIQLEQFGKRAGWDDPEMDIYNDLDPRRKS